MNLTNKRRNGFYWVGGKAYISVTTVLNIIDKPALTEWKIKNVYEAVKENPKLSLKEAKDVSWQLSKEAMDRGTAVHDIVEHWDTDFTLENNKESPFLPYLEAYDKFLSEHTLEVVENEKSVLHPILRYGGTFDRLGILDGELALIDFKTNEKAVLYDSVKMQASAYRRALALEDEKYAKIPMYGLALGENGDYLLEELEDSWLAFRSALYLWYWHNKKKARSAGINLG